MNIDLELFQYLTTEEATFLLQQTREKNATALPQPFQVPPQARLPSPKPEVIVNKFEEEAKRIFHILIPVTLSLILSIFLCLIYYHLPSTEQARQYITVAIDVQDSTTDSTFFGKRNSFKRSIIMAASLVFSLVLATGLLVLFLYCGWYKLLKLWLLFSVVFIMMIVPLKFNELMLSFNIEIDYLTFAILSWNWLAVGVIAFFWKSPAFVQRAYLVIFCVSFGNIIGSLNETFCLIVVGLVSIYDLISVCWDKGLLNLLIKISRERNKSIPALVYISFAFYVFLASNEDEMESQKQKEKRKKKARKEMLKQKKQRRKKRLEIQKNNAEILRQVQNSKESVNKKQQGIKLGAGDFVFYSALITRVSFLREPIPIITTAFAILFGLVITLAILIKYKKPVPALPIPILLGVSSYFISKYMLSDYCNNNWFYSY
ncbi:presenilin [Anaeramoeba flamelloides]|uniref:Presenilin n=1 Tax=Anaeramoeba flamelloides TaxID=1746091 RepID=A0ABQ8Z9X4_9EUKA|nr:presenilin [Anaeramoeba flamelloides]